VSKKPVHIHVTGDAYRAVFFMNPGTFGRDNDELTRAYGPVIPVGTEYIFRAILAACNPLGMVDKKGREAQASDQSSVLVTRAGGEAPFRASGDQSAIYQIRRNIDESERRQKDPGEPPLLLLANADTQEVTLPDGVFGSLKPCGSGDIVNDLSRIHAKPNVLVHWFGELADGGRPDPQILAKPKPCDVHIQIGLPKKHVVPSTLAKPKLARILIVNVGQISASHRIRKTMSYEAIAVDLLRYLRGDGTSENLDTVALKSLSMDESSAPEHSILAVRLNNSAVFLYACGRKPKSKPQEEVKGGYRELGAWLICHKEECAPLSLPELGQMIGFMGFVSAQIAAEVSHVLTEQLVRGGEVTRESEVDRHEFLVRIRRAVKRSLTWQRVFLERGYARMLFDMNDDSTGRPKLISYEVDKPWIGYDEMFQDVVGTLHKKQLGVEAVREKRHRPEKESDFTNSNRDSKQNQKAFTEFCEKDVLEIKVDIPWAVAHRTQWFMARSVACEKIENRSAAMNGGETRRANATDEEIEKEFLRISMSWLSKTDKAIEIPSQSGIPIVSIGEARLTDRREVEDYLAIQQALHAYHSTDPSKPLSIAVFGSPGAGKSFAVTQVVKHLSDDGNRSKFKKQPLTFNLGQFRSFDDLASALHLVRNECLSPEIPIVFFDEFDSSLQGQPFGWLKYFLAPMQDGEFYHEGRNFRIGRSVFVFAGGVNRSFEELNGRVRNPGFCEAKGPDFVSRLKAHLNVQGINNPEDETDQHRYILRRGILLRDIVRKRMKLKEKQKVDELLHGSVAHALLKIKRFKHGIRSLEAIITMCAVRAGFPIGPSDLPSLDQLEMHVDAMSLLRLVENYDGDSK